MIADDSTAKGLRRAWDAAGSSYHEFAETLVLAIDDLLSELSLPPGARALDAACGTGTVATALARLGASVIGIDFARSMVQDANRRAGEAALAQRAQFVVGDIEQLPITTGSLDAVVSNFGLIFALDHEAVATELARVMRPGGVLAFTAWIPEEPNLSLMTITSRYEPLPRLQYGVFDWGCEDHIRHMLAPAFEPITLRRGNVPWICSSPSDAIDMLLHRSLGPTMHAFKSAGTAARLSIHRDLIRLLARCLVDDGSIRLDRSYLAVRAVRKSAL